MVNESDNHSINLVNDDEPLIREQNVAEEDATSFLSFQLSDGTEIGSCSFEDDLYRCYDGSLNHTGNKHYIANITKPQASEGNEEKLCRICQDNDGELIAPCRCSGSIKWIHRTCLDQWRAQSFNSQNFVSCSMCKQPYVFKRIDQSKEATTKYRLLILRDLLLLLSVLVAFVGVCVAVSLLVNYFSFPLADSLPANWQTGFNRYFFACVMGIGLFFATFGVIAILFMLFSCCLWCVGTTVPEGPHGCFWIYIYCFPWTRPTYTSPRATSESSCCSGCGGCNGTGCTGCDSSGCHGCGGCDCGGCDGEAALVAFVIIFLLLIIIGIIALLVFLVVFVSAAASRHVHILYNKTRTQEYVVQDLAALPGEIPV